MKNYLICVVLIVSYFLQSCSNTNLQDHSEIVFADSIKSVADSVIAMENLLKRIYKSEKHNCYINNLDELVYSGKTIGSWEQIKKEPNSVLNNDKLKELDSDQTMHLIQLLSYLMKNNISGAYYDVYLNIYMFPYYRKVFLHVEHDYRNIVVNHGRARVKLKGYRILDEKEGLLLVSPTRN